MATYCFGFWVRSMDPHGWDCPGPGPKNIFWRGQLRREPSPVRRTGLDTSSLDPCGPSQQVTEKERRGLLRGGNCFAE